MGIPMGGSLSPVYAIEICCYCENEFNKSIDTDKKFIIGIRYVDDGLTFI